MKNEPIKLGDKVVIGLSTVADGDMRAVDKTGAELEQIYENQRRFLERNGFSAERTVLVKMSYDTEDFRRYSTVGAEDAGSGMTKDRSVSHDALATREKELGLFLPIADCVGAVIFDPEHEALMVSHLGRHNVLQEGGEEGVKYLIQQFKSDPKKLLVWLSPAGGKENFPVWARDNKGLRELAVEQLVRVGVKSKSVFGDDIDTTTDPNYYSHSIALKTGKDLNKRFAIVARMT